MSCHVNQLVSSTPAPLTGSSTPASSTTAAGSAPVSSSASLVSNPVALAAQTGSVQNPGIFGDKNPPNIPTAAAATAAAATAAKARKEKKEARSMTKGPERLIGSGSPELRGATTRAEMYNKFQPWVLATYGDSAKTKTITRKKAAR